MPIIEVKCYFSYKADGKPVSFILNDGKLMVEKIIDQWRGPDVEYFKVLADDGKGYLLTREHDHAEWELEKVLAL